MAQSISIRSGRNPDTWVDRTFPHIVSHITERFSWREIHENRQLKTQFCDKVYSKSCLLCSYQLANPVWLDNQSPKQSSPDNWKPQKRTFQNEIWSQLNCYQNPLKNKKVTVSCFFSAEKTREVRTPGTGILRKISTEHFAILATSGRPSNSEQKTKEGTLWKSCESNIQEARFQRVPPYQKLSKNILK